MTGSAAAQTAGYESKGAADFKWSTRTAVPGPTGKVVNLSGTGYKFDISVGADLDPVGSPTTEPLLLVDMPTASVRASWSDDKTISLEPLDGTLEDAILQVHNTLAPHISASITLAGFNLGFNYNATQLVAQVPGAVWKYNGYKKQAFDPWGFNATTADVPPDPAHLLLVSTTFASLGMATTTATGTLSINGQIDPEAFTYVTKSIKLGEGGTLSASGGKVQIPTVDTDYLDLPVNLTGELTYAGHVKIGPAIRLESLGDPAGSGVSGTTLGAACAVLSSTVNALSFLSAVSNPAGCLIDLSGPLTMADLPYGSSTSPGAPIAVDFPLTTIHIPLPNVKLASKSLDMGAVEVGTSKKETVQIKNTGELGATLAFKSSDPRFTVGANASAAAKGTYDLEITFSPTEVGAASATITVTSNDPNEPVQTIQVTASGATNVGPTDDAGTGSGSGGAAAAGTGEDSGCGCHVIDAGTSSSPYGLVGFAALGLALAGRRRRR